MWAYPGRQNVTTSMVGLEMVMYTKISLKMVNPRDIAGERRKRRTCGHIIPLQWWLDEKKTTIVKHSHLVFRRVVYTVKEKACMWHRFPFCSVFCWLCSTERTKLKRKTVKTVFWSLVSYKSWDFLKIFFQILSSVTRDHTLQKLWSFSMFGAHEVAFFNLNQSLKLKYQWKDLTALDI